MAALETTMIKLDCTPYVQEKPRWMKKVKCESETNDDPQIVEENVGKNLYRPEKGKGLF